MKGGFMVVVIGEILFDIFPKYKRLGGAPFNFAYHLKQLGLSVRFISRIGVDGNGKRILQRIEEAGFDPGDIQQDAAHPTGTVQVTLDNAGVPEFDIVSDVAYDFIEFSRSDHEKLLRHADLLYFGTLVQRTARGFDQIQRFLQRRRHDTLFFHDINLRRGCYSDEVIQASLEKADVLKLNTDELRECKRVTGNKLEDDAAFIRWMTERYALNAVALTKGAHGRELHTGKSVSRAATEPLASIADTVGAGDAYAAMLAKGILLKWPPHQTVSMAAAFAARMCTVEGALPGTKNFYDPFRHPMKDGE
jgi:fructokinase